MRCQCEHEDHFGDRPKGVHVYGAEEDDVRTQRTTDGNLELCKRCREICHDDGLTQQIDAEWDKSPFRHTDWLGLERLLRDILNANTRSDAEKVALAKEAIAAFTRRG